MAIPTPVRTRPRPRPWSPDSPSTANESLDRACEAMLGKNLAIALGLLCVFQLASWMPQYLTWPLYPDHDVFASMAREWHEGALPYRDHLGNNFPGTIYLFWLVGRIGGWSNAQAFLYIDALLLTGFCVLMAVWSKRTIGRFAPGLMGVLTILGYYCSLNYSQTAQRDWQAPLLAIAGVLVLQGWRGFASRSISAVLLALALSIRPQSLLFLPVYMMELGSEGTLERGGTVRSSLPSVFWLVSFAVAVVALILPLAISAALGDFFRSLRIVAVGGSYNRASIGRFLSTWLGQASQGKVLAIGLIVPVLAYDSKLEVRRSARSALAALVGASFYKPISPYPHEYLNHPLIIAWAWCAAVAVGAVMARTDWRPAARFVVVALTFGLGADVKPSFCNPIRSMRSLRDLAARRNPIDAPAGYTRHPRVSLSALYRWHDYRALLDYLEHDVPRSTRVANALKGTPALLGPSGLRTAFPAESIAWLRLVNPKDEGLFATALKNEKDCLVVWSPSEFESGMEPRLDDLRSAIETSFEPHARFGVIEVWTRRKTQMKDQTR